MNEAWKKQWEAKRKKQAKQQPEYRLALDIHSGHTPNPVPGPHFPDFPAHGRGIMKWACGAKDCDYWTGYQTRTKASKMILAHCKAKNEQLQREDSA